MGENYDERRGDRRRHTTGGPGAPAAVAGMSGGAYRSTAPSSFSAARWASVMPVTPLMFMPA